MKNRGSPMWIPEPNNNLPIEYRRNGTTVGDVGIITESGSFDFLFNICLPSEHPINEGCVPKGFVPIQMLKRDIRRHTEFNLGSFLASTSVEKSQYKGNFATSSLVFESSSSASEGAILTMPQGAKSEDLANIWHFERYMIRYIESWYRFINGERGRNAKNGDVRLVIGCDKATEWGMATFKSSTTRNEPCRFKFRLTGESPFGPVYSWRHSSMGRMAEVRTGPVPNDVKELTALGNLHDGPPYTNQALFVRVKVDPIFTLPRP
ncbi:hypothetical protein GALMADRAFT_882546 [Galerina marginata CBS 339.88]|uniref:Uncharacterized protein n=1 Tax=Galerina marginata (strain CBS 339.88) TaxID=685588 RepID=A0A067SIK2_GALM3|nr:hypothetical protein GALMADRAFT_882546 [Galerina marginata CBS 339.88]